jgi:hypothetical protein
MTGALSPDADSSALVQPFPKPGRLVRFAIENSISQRVGNKITFCLSKIW